MSIVTVQVDGSSASTTVEVSQPVGTIVWKADGSLPISQEWAEYSTPKNCLSYTNAVASDPNVFFQTAIKPPGSSLPGAYEFIADVPGGAGGCYGHRAEVAQGLPERPGFSETRHFVQGDDRWFSWQVLLDSDYPVSNNNWNLICQWKGNINSGTQDSVSGMQITSGTLFLGIPTYYAALLPVSTGKWIKISVHLMFHNSPSVGFVEAWADNGDGQGMRQVMTRHYGYTLVTDASGNWVAANSRVGIYRNGVIPGTAHMYVAGYTVATTRAAAEASAFR